MKTIKLLAFFLSIISVHSMAAQVTPNSKRFEVKDYISSDAAGNYRLYHTHGYVEKTSTSGKPRIFLMPLIDIDLNQIKYIDDQGLETYSGNSNISSISIAVTSKSAYPNDSEKPGIIAAIDDGTTMAGFYPPLLQNMDGSTSMIPYAMRAYGLQGVNSLNQIATVYKGYLDKQNEMIKSYSDNYKPEIISLKEYEIILRVNGENVYDQSFDGTYVSMGGTLSNIVLRNPSVFTKNMIRQGNFEVFVKYKFVDSKNSYINAKVNAGLIVERFLNESQISHTKSSSSGWSFLGFGSRRRSLKSSFTQQVDQKYNSERFENTQIEMFDADDDLITMFENDFFPELTRQKTIENHLAQAAAFEASGNDKMMKLHTDYVQLLQNYNPDLEVDIDKAMASLAKEDYAGFLAHGVRWGDYKASGNQEFRRVLNGQERQNIEQTWEVNKKISVLHSVSQRVNIKETVPTAPSLGIIEIFPFQLANQPVKIGNWESYRNIRGVVIGGLFYGSPLHQSQVLPGSLVTKIGGANVHDATSLRNIMNQLSPGDYVSATVLNFIVNPMNGFAYWEEHDYNLQVKGFPKIN